MRWKEMQIILLFPFPRILHYFWLRDNQEVEWRRPHISLYWISFHWELGITYASFPSPRQHVVVGEPGQYLLLESQGRPASLTFILAALMGDESGIRENTDTLPNHLQFASQTGGQSLNQTMVIDYSFLNGIFFFGMNSKQEWKFLQIFVSYGLVLSVRKSVSVTSRFRLLNLMDINQFLNYLGSKYLYENVWKEKTLPWVGLC